jgi:DNA-binding GntR family transcriptional regulator
MAGATGESEAAPSGRRAEAEGLMQALRLRIASHELPPGAKLREQELADEFGVSRARVRETLGRLEQRGLVERIPNRGAVVIRLTPEQVCELYDTREVLEGLAVRLATLNAPPESWLSLAEAFGEPAEKAVLDGELETYSELLATFRARVIAACGSALVASLLDTLHERTAYLVRRLILVPGRALDGLKEHRAVIEAMLRGDAEAAEALKRANIRSAKACFSRYQRFVL